MILALYLGIAFLMFVGLIVCQLKFQDDHLTVKLAFGFFICSATWPLLTLTAGLVAMYSSLLLLFDGWDNRKSKILKYNKWATAKSVLDRMAGQQDQLGSGSGPTGPSGVSTP